MWMPEDVSLMQIARTPLMACSSRALRPSRVLLTRLGSALCPSGPRSVDSTWSSLVLPLAGGPLRKITLLNGFSPISAYPSALTSAYFVKETAPTERNSSREYFGQAAPGSHATSRQ